MFKSDSKSKLSNEQTGVEFYQPVTHQEEEQFLNQIELEKEYLERLKGQRQKIEGLYAKYDVLLSQMNKKDNTIREKEEKVKLMDSKVKQLELSCQQFSLIREQNRELINENMALKHRIMTLEKENQEITEQIKLKQCLISDEKFELEHINQQLQEKVNSLTNKLALAQQEFKQNLEAEKYRMQSLKSNHLAQISPMVGELNLLKSQMMKKDQIVHILRLENQFVQQKLSDQEQNYSIYLKDLETKIQKNQRQKKLQIKTLKDVIQEKSLEIGTLESKIVGLKHSLELKEFELQESRKLLREEKRVFQDDVFQLKSQMNNQKIYFKEQLMYCQNHIQKLEKKLSESLKREKQLGGRIKRFESNQAVKRNLRQIQRQQMQKINKILSLK